MKNFGIFFLFLVKMQGNSEKTGSGRGDEGASFVITKTYSKEIK